LMTPLIHGLAPVEALAAAVMAKEAAKTLEVVEVAVGVMTTTIAGAGAMTTTIAIAAADVMTAMIGAAVVTLVIAIAVAELHRLRGKQCVRQKYSSVVSISDTTGVIFSFMGLAAIEAARVYSIFCQLPHCVFHDCSLGLVIRLVMSHEPWDPNLFSWCRSFFSGIWFCASKSIDQEILP